MLLRSLIVFVKSFIDLSISFCAFFIPDISASSFIPPYTSVSALSASKFVVVYRDNLSSGNGTAIIRDVSGSTITFGSPTIFNMGNTTYISTSALTASKIVIAYRDEADSDQGTAIFSACTAPTS